MFLGNSFCAEISPLQSTPAPLYAPWRADYDNKVATALQQAQPKLCRLCKVNELNEENFIVYRGNKNNIMLAGNPYILPSQGIHLLIVPHEHIGDIFYRSETSDEMNSLTRKLSILFSPQCHKMLVNTNEGSASGASIPTHHHRHIIIMMMVPSPNFAQTVQQAPKSINLTAISHSLQSIFKTTLPALEHAFLRQMSTYHPHCYLCSIAKNTSLENDEKNLVVYRGEDGLAMLAHRPTYFGQMDIFPLKHYETPGAMDKKVTYYAINMLARVFQRIICKLVNAQGCNIGYSCSTADASDTNHFCLHIIPRKESWVSSPIIGPVINGDLKDLYGKLKNWGQHAKM